MQDKGIGSVVLSVEVCRAGTWERVFASPLLRWGTLQDIRADIAGAEQLRLSTTDGGDGIYGDHAVWAAAKLQ